MLRQQEHSIHLIDISLFSISNRLFIGNTKKTTTWFDPIESILLIKADDVVSNDDDDDDRDVLDVKTNANWTVENSATLKRRSRNIETNQRFTNLIWL